MSIKSLDKFTIKKITTAQVITSVYSVIKELVENALDAGANNIEVILQEKGLCLIEVRDNGSGISEVDTPYMGLQAYTSKLVDFNGLDSLETYGFRGEALSALCRVSTVKIITRTTADDAARCYTLDLDGKIVKAEYSHRSIGTTVRAEYLFKNYPVRRQSISNSKKANQEIKDIEMLLKDYGICRPEVRFHFAVDNVSNFIKQSRDNFKQSLIEIYGTKIISNYEFFDVTKNEICVELAIPEKHLSDLALVSQIVYAHISINTRPVIFKEFKDLIMELLFQHFNTKISSKKKPLIFLKIIMPPSCIDINLEPNKTAVLLKNKSEVMEIVKKLMVDYYGLVIEPEEVDNTSMVETPAYFDTTMDDSEAEKEVSANKKRKLQMNNKATSVKKRKSNPDDNDKENEAINSIEYNKVADNNEEPCLPINEVMSQLPEVDLGEDFCTQEIREIPVLSSEEVDNLMSKIVSNKTTSNIENNSARLTIPNLATEQLKRTENNVLGTSPINLEISNSDQNVPEKPFIDLEINNSDKNEANVPLKITEEQWSRGHCSNLQGGTDIIASGPSSEKLLKNLSKPEKTPKRNSDPNSVGFSKFCQITRERLLEKNPQMNAVDLAQEISKEWKYLDSEERQYFRDLGKRDNLSNSTLNESLKKVKVSPQIRHKNKNRLLKLLQNATNTKQPIKDESSERNMKTIILWDMNTAKIRENSFIKAQNIGKNKKSIIGKLNNDIWLVNLNAQIWILNSMQLFDGLNLTSLELTTNKDNPEAIEDYLNRWLHEKEDMSLLHPIFDLNKD